MIRADFVPTRFGVSFFRGTHHPACPFSKRFGDFAAPEQDGPQ
jgi:hypothetical protein